MSLGSGDQTRPTTALTLNDTRTGESAGLGWNLTITPTQFTTGSRTLSISASKAVGAGAGANGGLCTAPTNSIAYLVAVPASSTPPSVSLLLSRPRWGERGGNERGQNRLFDDLR